MTNFAKFVFETGEFELKQDICEECTPTSRSKSEISATRGGDYDLRHTQEVVKVFVGEASLVNDDEVRGLDR